MPSKLDDSSNLRFLHACLFHSDYSRIDFPAVAKAFNIQAPAARMRFGRLKASLNGEEPGSTKRPRKADDGSGPSKKKAKMGKGKGFGLENGDNDDDEDVAIKREDGVEDMKMEESVGRMEGVKMEREVVKKEGEDGGRRRVASKPEGLLGVLMMEQAGQSDAGREMVKWSGLKEEDFKPGGL